jgi:hypothetical protein
MNFPLDKVNTNIVHGMYRLIINGKEFIHFEQLGHGVASAMQCWLFFFHNKRLFKKEVTALRFYCSVH